MLPPERAETSLTSIATPTSGLRGGDGSFAAAWASASCSASSNEKLGEKPITSPSPAPAALGPAALGPAAMGVAGRLAGSSGGGGDDATGTSCRTGASTPIEYTTTLFGVRSDANA